MRRADSLTTFLCRLSSNSGSLNLLEPSGPVQACNGIALPLPSWEADSSSASQDISHRWKRKVCVCGPNNLRYPEPNQFNSCHSSKTILILCSRPMSIFLRFSHRKPVRISFFLFFFYLVHATFAAHLIFLEFIAE